jgi:hypothetical protein
MVISLEDAIAILRKWKDESAHIFVSAESPLRPTSREKKAGAVRWTMNQHVKVLRVLAPPAIGESNKAIVEFEGPSGTLGISLGGCRFVYEEPREASSDVRDEAETSTVSALSLFFSSDESFTFYEMREP